MRRFVIVLIVMSGLAAMPGSVVPSVSSARPTAAGPVVPPPSSMAATGASFTVGFNTGGPLPGGGTCGFAMECREYSWSTGTLVNSHYQRLLALNPALAGHAINAAESGATIKRFVTQINTFASSRPDYVTVLTSSNDICRGDPPPMDVSQHNPPTAVADFAARFRAGMDALFAASPNSRVLVASLENLESIRSAVLARNPSATWQPALCRDAFFSRSNAERAMLMGVLAQYNAVLQRECATYTNCCFDGYALTNHVWSPGEVGSDNLHPSVAGEEMMAQVTFDAGCKWAPTTGRAPPQPEPGPPQPQPEPGPPAPMPGRATVTG